MATQENILDWAETVVDLLSLIPREDRARVLAEATRIVAEDNKRPMVGVPLDEIRACRNWKGKMKFKSHAVLLFVRDITNNHSTQEADKLLFMQHHGPGSGYLIDYIDDLKTVRKFRRNQSQSLSISKQLGKANTLGKAILAEAFEQTLSLKDARGALADCVTAWQQTAAELGVSDAPYIFDTKGRFLVLSASEIAALPNKLAERYSEIRLAAETIHRLESDAETEVYPALPRG